MFGSHLSCKVGSFGEIRYWGMKGKFTGCCVRVGSDQTGFFCIFKEHLHRTRNLSGSRQNAIPSVDVIDEIYTIKLKRFFDCSFVWTRSSLEIPVGFGNLFLYMIAT